MSRLLFKLSITELEAAFAVRRTDEAFLDVLTEELSHRSTDRSKRLRDIVEKQRKTVAIEFRAQNVSSQHAEPADTTKSEPSDRNASTGDRNNAPHPKRDPTPVPTISNAPENILSAWTALEVLSPPAFRRPEDLAGGDRRAVARLEGSELPWERGEKSRPNCRLYYQIVLGTIKMDRAIDLLMERYGDSRAELPPTKNAAILAVVVVDRQGRLVGSPAVSLSSFGWGVMAAVRGKLTDLARWPQIEPEMVQCVEKQLFSFGDGEEEDDKRKTPLTRRALISSYEFLVKELRLPVEILEAPSFAVRSYEYFKSPSPPEPLLLNSFYLGDLGMAQTLLSQKMAPDVLKRFLGTMVPPVRRDLLRDTRALDEAVAPTETPLARWPSPGRYPLALLQQAAVNLALSENRASDLLGVNGPPGTGKTTLVRDILAGVITTRAEVMSQMDDPETAFKHSGQKLKAGSGWLHLYHVDPTLRGFEMVVASSNNKAVENVSTELPASSSIASDADNLRYFKVLSGALHDRDTWGLVAAVLGNGANRVRFKQTFWWDEDLSMNSYLSAVCGSIPQVSQKDSMSGHAEFRAPKIVLHEQPPSNHEAALARWNKARERFKTARERSAKWQKWLDSIRADIGAIESLIEGEKFAYDVREFWIARMRGAVDQQRIADENLADAGIESRLREEELARHLVVRPPFWARLFRVPSARRWSESKAARTASFAAARRKVAEKSSAAAQAEETLQLAVQTHHQAQLELNAASEARISTENRLKIAREKHGVSMVDDEFFSQDYNRKHQATPWYSAEAQRARDDLFVAAISLHRAFIDAAAKPIRHNLGALMNAFSAGSLPSSEKEALLPDLWATLFLVVPLISTTFASVGRMLGKLPPQSLGWLLIDEAGQALPQAAVGAIIRSQRVIAVGDPAQIEPVVILPDQLTSAITRSFGVDPDTFRFRSSRTTSAPSSGHHLSSPTPSM